MALALEQAQAAVRMNEVPVGAIIVDRDSQNVIGRGFNCSISNHDPCAHAEVMALRDAAAHLKNYRLPGTVMYVTLEPCIMCIGGILHARLGRVVYGAPNTKKGISKSIMSLEQISEIHGHTTVHGGVLAEISSSLLKDFFCCRRLEKRK